MTVSRRISFAAGLAVAGMAATVAMAQTAQPKACIEISDDKVIFTGLCQALPNSSLTPGAIASHDKAEICGRDANGLTYTKAHRHTTEAMKRQVAAEYGVPWADRDQYEFDHLVPIGLGGADTIANLWPQPLAEALVKDREEEDPMIRDVCDGRISLDAAQRYFLGTEWEQR